TEKHFRAMRDIPSGRNIGHFVKQIDMAWTHENYSHTKHVINPQTDPYNVARKDIIVIAEGRRGNLGCATGHPSCVIPNSFSNQTLAQLELWTNSGDYKPGVYVLPKHLDEKVAALHLGKLDVELDVLTEEQAEYIGVKPEGPFKPEYYRY